MSLTSRHLAPLLAAVAVSGLALVFLGREKKAAIPAPDGPAASASPAPADRTPAALTSSNVGLSTPAPPPGADSAPLRPPPLELSSGPLAWERQIADAAARGRNATGKARELFALLPRLPEEALATAAEQAVESLPNADYAATVLPVVTHPQTSGQVLSVLFADLMERPDTITLPALLSIAKNPAHPFAPAALDNLRLLLGANFGSDWTKWNEAVQQAAARPPDRPK